MDPAVLVLDEPTTGQDGPGVARVGAIVDALAAAGRTVIAITHDMEFAASHFGRIVVMREGVVIADGPPATVFAPGRAELLASAGLNCRRRPGSAQPSAWARRQPSATSWRRSPSAAEARVGWPHERRTGRAIDRPGP